MKVKFLDLNDQYYKIKDEIDSAIGNVIETSSFIGGESVKLFEKNFEAPIRLMKNKVTYKL